jgi:hypothetical protein
MPCPYYATVVLDDMQFEQGCTAVRPYENATVTCMAGKGIFIVFQHQERPACEKP